MKAPCFRDEGSEEWEVGDKHRRTHPAQPVVSEEQALKPHFLRSQHRDYPRDHAASP